MTSAARGGGPAERADHGGEILGQGRPDRERRAGDRVIETQLDAREQQAVAAEQLPEELVVPALPVRRVAHDVVRRVAEVPAQLMPPPGAWRKLEQAVPAGRVAIDAVRQLDRAEAPETRHRLLGDAVEGLAPTLGRVEAPDERVVDLAFLGRVPAHDGQVGPSQRVEPNRLAQGRRDLRREPEQERPGRALVEAVDGVHAPPELSPQELDGEALLVGVEARAVHEQARGLVDRDEVLVTEEDRQHA